VSKRCERLSWNFRVLAPESLKQCIGLADALDPGLEIRRAIRARTMFSCLCQQHEPACTCRVSSTGQCAGFVVNVGDRVFFETDQTDLTQQARATLDKQAQWLMRYNRYAFKIEGHADERGTREYNIALGAKRAQTVRDYLVAHGIASSRMQTISCWSQSRRAVIVLDVSA
jgi:peptidoglycan-associated lipoprotein